MNDKKEILTVLGGGESGVGAAVLGKTKGMQVFLSDMGDISDHYREILDSEGIEYETGHHTEERILEADVVVKSPEYRPAPLLSVKSWRKGFPSFPKLSSQRDTPTQKWCASRGATAKPPLPCLPTTSSRRQGLNVGLAGNVGRSLAYQVARADHDYYVIELSSFQLENMYDFKADIAVIMNITPDHLDRYDNKMENYAAAKFRILRNQTGDDWFIYWKDDDPVIKQQLEQVQTEAMQLPFSELQEDGNAACVDDGIVRFVTPREVWDIPRDRLAPSWPPQPIQLHGRRPLRIHPQHPQGGYPPCPRELRGSGAPPRIRGHHRRSPLCQRLQGHQRQLHLVCSRKHDRTHRADPRRQGTKETIIPK